MKIVLIIPTKEVSDAVEAALAVAGLAIMPVEGSSDTVFAVRNIPKYLRVVWVKEPPQEGAVL